MSLNISDSKNRYSIRGNIVHDRTMNQSRSIDNLPDANKLAAMHEKTFVNGCKAALAGGKWPS